MKLKWKIAFFSICLVFTILFLIDLSLKINFEFLSFLFSSVNIGFLFVAILIYLFMNFLRALRYRKFYEYKIKLTKMFSINSYHNYLNHTIPYRLGEFGLIYFMKNEKIEVTKSLSALLFTRILDFSIAGLIFFDFSIATIFVFDHPELFLIASSIIGTISLIGFFL